MSVKVFGVELEPMYRGSSHEGRVAGKSLTIAGYPEFGSCVYWGGGVLTVLDKGTTWPVAIVAIERKLLDIRDAINSAVKAAKGE